jgi:hypothetical protein
MIIQLTVALIALVALMFMRSLTEAAVIVMSAVLFSILLAYAWQPWTR